MRHTKLSFDCVAAMSAYRRFIPLVAGVLTLIGLEIFLAKTQTYRTVAIALLLVDLVAIHVLLGPGLKTKRSRLEFLIIPVFLTWSGITFALLTESATVRHILAVVVALCTLLYFESMFTYVWQHQQYVAFSLENLSGYAATLTIFFISASLLGMSVLLDLHLVWLLLAYLVSLGLIGYELFWVSKLLSQQSLLFTLVITLMLGELFLVMRALPLHYLSGGAALTVLWYTAVILARARLTGVLTAKMVKRHLGLAAILLLVILGTARWI